MIGRGGNRYGATTHPHRPPRVIHVESSALPAAHSSAWLVFFLTIPTIPKTFPQIHLHIFNVAIDGGMTDRRPLPCRSKPNKI